MEALQGYHSEASDEAASPEGRGPAGAASLRLPPTVAAAPPVPARARSSLLAASAGAGATTLALVPMAAAAMAAAGPLYGPAPPEEVVRRAGRGAQRQPALEANLHVDPEAFHRERSRFQATGEAAAPEATGGDGGTAGEAVVRRTTLGYDRPRLEAFARQDAQRAAKRARKLEAAARGGDSDDDLVQDSDDEATYGVWAPPGREERMERENALTDLERGVELAPEQLAEREYIAERNRQRGVQEEQDAMAEQLSTYERRLQQKMAHLLPPAHLQSMKEEPSSTFHGGEEKDYQGRSWMAPPPGLASATADVFSPLYDGDHDIGFRCKVPKKCVTKVTHTEKGVHRIRLFPKTGHLLLSAGLDGTCRVWRISDKQLQLMRIYRGHVAAVRDVQFNSSGQQFVSASFDRSLRLWETESGKVLQTFSSHGSAVPYCVEFYPLDDRYFVVGCSNNKIITYHTETGEITQEYNHHLAPVNAILFVKSEEGGMKMVSASDDKKVLVWEWDIGVPIKYISDPTMQSMPCLSLHPPDHQFFVGQSLDNTIVVFQATKRFAMQKKKKFSGHVVSGYACQMAFSPDGQYLVSGDGNGNVFLWDWKRHKILQKYKAHTQGPAICCAWHPLHPSTLLTCGWDGTIKMWQ